MRRRLLYHEAKGTERTISDYEIHIETFEYDPIKSTDKESTPRVVYYYIPIYNDGTTGDKVYNTDSNNEAIAEFELVSTNYSDVKLDTGTGIITCEEWDPNETGSSGQYRDLATVRLTVKIKRPNTTNLYREDYSTTTAQQASKNITWDKPVVELSYDVALAQPEEEGGKITLMPTVKWTQQGTDEDGNSVTPNSNENANATYVFTLLDGESNIESLDANTGELVVKSSTLEEEHWIAKVEVEVIYMQQSGTGNCDVYQEAYEEKEPIPTDGVFPMDILMLNNETHKQEILGRDEHTYNDFPKDKYTPIGIILTPVADDTGFSAGKQYSGYGNDIGVMGVIALTDASLSSPEVGTTDPSEIMCGNEWSYDDLTGLWCIPAVYTILPYVDSNGNPTNDIQGDANLNWSIPDYNSNQISVVTDKDDIVASPVDAWSGYADANGHKAASPYYVTEKYKDEEYNGKSDWDFEGYNEVAYDPYDTFNPNTDDISAFADYNGELNSIAILIRKSWTRGREWIENTTVNSNSNDTDCPAVEACWKYAPEGTAQGGWYLPAIGELLLMAARFNKINDTLTLLNQYYGVSVSLLKDTNIPYLSSTSFHSSDLYDSSIDGVVSSRLVFALFPNVNGDAGVNNICTTNITGATRYGGYVRPFKKIKNEIPSNASVNAYKFTPHYELMPAHYTKTLCDKDSNREWFGQKFILSLRRGCVYDASDLSGFDIHNLRIYGYKVKGENDTTKIDDSPRLLAEIYVNGINDCKTFPSDGQGGYEGDEKGLNIIGRFTTKYQFDIDGAYDEEKEDYVNMDTDDFDRDGTVEPGWYILAGIGVNGLASGEIGSSEHLLSKGTFKTVTNKEIATADSTTIYGDPTTIEDKQSFVDMIKSTTFMTITNATDKPFYVGQLDRTVALIFGATAVSESD